MKKILAILSIVVIAAGSGAFGYAYVKLIINPEKAARHVTVAKAAIASGDTKSAETNARLAVSLNEKSGIAHYILARSMVFNSSALREDVLKRFLAAEKLGVNSAEFYAELAETYMELGNFDAAASAVEKSLLKAPDNGLAVYYKILLLILREQDFEIALPLARENAEKNPAFPQTKRILALVLHGTGRSAEALDVLDQAISENPEYCLLYPLKAEIIKITSESEADALLLRAEKLATATLKNNASDQSSNYCLANTYSVKGDLAASRGDPEELVRAFYEQAMSVNVPRGNISDLFRQSAINTLGL